MGRRGGEHAGERARGGEFGPEERGTGGGRPGCGGGEERGA